MKRKTLKGGIVMGACMTGADVEAGRIRSTLSAQQWHEKCPGGVQSQGVWKPCTCRHHDLERAPRDVS